jgi:hypothetical protein
MSSSHPRSFRESYVLSLYRRLDQRYQDVILVLLEGRLEDNEASSLFNSAAESSEEKKQIHYKPKLMKSRSVCGNESVVVSFSRGA